jgi:hypothetical protein
MKDEIKSKFKKFNNNKKRFIQSGSNYIKQLYGMQKKDAAAIAKKCFISMNN